MNGPKRLSLRHNFLWIFLGSLVESGAKWVTYMVLTKTATVAAVGTFSLALAVATPITILAQVQLRVALITDAKNEHRFGAYYALRIVCVSLSLVAVAAVATAAYGLSDTGWLIVLVGISQAVVSLRDMWIGLAQKHERMDVTSRGNMLDGLLSLGLFSAALVTTGSVAWAVGGTITARVLVLIGYDMRRVRALVGTALDTEPLWQWRDIRKLFWTALPLGLTTALVSLNSNVPRYFIERWVGRDELGYFAAIAYFVFASQIVVGALSRAASPRLAALYHQDRRGYGALLGKLLAIAVVLAAGGVLMTVVVGEPVLRLAYSAKYAEKSHILVLLMAGGGVLFLNSFLGTAISAARFFKLQTATYITVVLTTLAACAMLVPQRGLEGAAWALIASAVVNTLINGAVVVYAYRRAPRQ